MDCLLDTHTLLWFESGNKLLPKKVKELIENTTSKNYVSIASIWEIAIKISLNKLDLKISLEELLLKIEKNNFIILQIELKHILKISNLPFHHRDPFDRIIISQALTENLILISKDTIFKNYKVKLLWDK